MGILNDVLIIMITNKNTCNVWIRKYTTHTVYGHKNGIINGKRYQWVLLITFDYPYYLEKVPGKLNMIPRLDVFPCIFQLISDISSQNYISIPRIIYAKKSSHFEMQAQNI
ncbi:hypothetical protein AFK64_05420 [Cronobacter sakazakii]|nr:hypothetical protein AFK64_05420 [Cronobacter sakazakii]